MTLFLGSLAALFGVTSFALALLYLVGLARNTQLRQQLEEERMWADEYRRRLDAAELNVAAVRQEYAKVLWLHDNAIIPMLSQAWQQVVKK